ncbi:MAG TPA: GNAT family N-acetyltransferase [Acidimicrobiia bacterium]
MDPFEPRTVRDDEFVDFLLAVQAGFGRTTHDELDEYPAHLLTPDRSLAVRDGTSVSGGTNGPVVATAGAYSFDLTVPGGARLPMAAVAMVTVHPTHRRRGILRRLMAAQLDDVTRRGEPLAGLTASEASIYERFGYGTATFTTRWDLESHHAHLQPAPAPSGRVRVVDATAAAAAAHAVYARIAPSRVGELSRPESWWPQLFAPARNGPRFFTAVHDDADGTPDAFARYVLDADWPDGVADTRLRVLEIQGVDAGAEAAMWSYLFGIDLVGTITAGERPVDDPLRWRLPDPRRLRVRQLRDHLWVRVLDVAAALSARTYDTADALVLELHDEFRPDNSGRWLIDGGPDGATCTRTDRAADLALSAADLGALYLGGVPVSTLAAAGRVRELTTGAVARGDRAFLTHPSPWCTTHF